MKSIKRMLAAALGLLLALALALPAFADDPTTTPPYTITITNNVSGYTYKAYQIFKVDLNNEDVSNVTWGSGVKDEGKTALLSFNESSYESAAKLAEALNDSNIQDFAKEAAKYLTENAAGTSVFKDGYYTISNLPAGYYLVVNTEVPTDEDENTENTFYSDYILKVVNNVTVTPKGDVPETDKKIVEGTEEKTEEKEANEASIGDTVNYEITGTLPTNFDDYKEYYYVFTDTLSKGLTYTEDSVQVLVVNGTSDETDVTDYFYKDAAVDNETGKTTITVGIQDLKALTLDDNDPTTVLPVTLTKGSKIVVKYSAVLNENAVIAGDGNTNDVQLSYSNDPNNSGEGTTTPPPENPDEPEPKDPNAVGETPQSTVETYTTELTILKTDENGNVLHGAEFTLTGNGVNVVVVKEEVFTESTDGKYYKLADGTYTLTAPEAMYNSLNIKYTLNEETNEYEESTDGKYYKLADGTYTLTAPEAMYAGLTTTYKKEIKTTVKGEGKEETTVVGTVDANGHVTFSGLGAGDYIITESHTPDGYNTIDPITFTITWDEENGFEVKPDENGNSPITVKDNTLSTTIINNKGPELPSTGGMGTTLFYIIGGILAVGAGVLLITKRRMDDGE